MARVQRIRRVAIAAEERPVLVSAGNKARPSEKLASKVGRNGTREVEERVSVGHPEVVRRSERLLHSNSSLDASMSSDCSTDSFRSRASMGGRRGLSCWTRGDAGVLPCSERMVPKLEKVVAEVQECQGKRRCPWVTPNTEACYAIFHDEEWGVPVHDDRRLFELLVLSSALAELTWPVILGKRHTFREVFVDFDPLAVSKFSEKKITTLGSVPRSLLSEPKLRATIENARQIVKIIEEFGSFRRYCWSFVNHKPIVSNFRYSRQVPVKTAKADAISKELVRRGFRGVGPTVVYSFMQAAGMTNDHLITCYRFEECRAPALPLVPSNTSVDMPILDKNICKMEEDSSLSTSDTTATTEQEDLNLELELVTSVGNLSFS